MFEPPGETHTLVVPDDVEEMITFFQVNGIIVLLRRLRRGDRIRGRVHEKSDLCRAHYEKVGLGVGLCRPVHSLKDL